MHLPKLPFASFLAARHCWGQLFVGRRARRQDRLHARLAEIATDNEGLRRQLKYALSQCFTLREENERLLATIGRVTAELGRLRIAQQKNECRGKSQ